MTVNSLSDIEMTLTAGFAGYVIVEMLTADVADGGQGKLAETGLECFSELKMAGLMLNRAASGEQP